MEFGINVYTYSMMLGSSLLLGLLSVERLNKKKILLWTVSLLPFLFIGVMIGRNFGEAEQFINLKLYSFLFMLTFNTMLSKLLLSISWLTGITVATISSCLYYSIYQIAAYLFQHLVLDGAAELEQAREAFPYILLAIVLQVLLLGIGMYVKRRLKKEELYKFFMKNERSSVELLFDLFVVVLSIAVAQLFTVEENIFYGVSAAVGGFLGVYLFCRNVLLSRKYEEEKQRYYKNMEEYSQRIDGINQGILDFKHDYHNILLSLDYYLESENMDELKQYYQKHVSATIHELETKD
ncbi:hypothetical protein [Enterococcus sp. BWR-S5]|uniref:hypothetical protein n=1 Tax=Enterococcus sp. BWR-S5 TaxID=2787714 RepID=UPI0019243CE7|nr:hypothetical protein [Enterococcus sp. BWR-S5]MBL1226012.1 hypothetical protein [Enterococcus sp. BWR-S5]